VRASAERVERLLDELPEAGELVRHVCELYGAGLARVLEIVGRSDPALVAELAADEVVGGLLLVHELHPSPLAERVAGALASVRPLLASHGGDVELVDLAPPRLVLRLVGSCGGCPSSEVTLRLAVERAVLEAAPEIEAVELAEQPPPSTPISLGRRPSYDSCPSELVAR